MAVTATIQRQSLKVAGRNIAPGIEFSLLATSAPGRPRQARYGSQSQTWLDGADMAALSARPEVEVHHISGPHSYLVGIARCEIITVVHRGRGERSVLHTKPQESRDARARRPAAWRIT